MNVCKFPISHVIYANFPGTYWDITITHTPLKNLNTHPGVISLFCKLYEQLIVQFIVKDSSCKTLQEYIWI